MKQIGSLFPLGGPVAPDLVIGREGVIADVEQRLREGLSTMLVGTRRIGKTTVCEAVCANLAVEVPERAEPRELLQLIIDRCTTLSLVDDVKTAAGVVRPLIERLPAKRTSLWISPASSTRRRRSCRCAKCSASRSSSPASGGTAECCSSTSSSASWTTTGARSSSRIWSISTAARRKVAVLVDGSEERTFDGMLGEPVHFGKLVDRLRLEDSIPRPVWREPLRNRFEQAGLVLPDEQLEALLTWGCEEPYRTMAASRYTALTARKTGSDTVAAFDVQMGCDEAERHLEDDGA